MDRNEQFILTAAAAKIAAGLSVLESAGWSATPERVYGEFFRPELLAELHAAKYKTNDLVALVGGVNAGRKELRVNASSIELDVREFLFLVVLGSALKGRLTSVAGDGAAFVPVEVILDEIDRVRGSEPGLQSQWRYPTAEDIRKVVFSLRAKITARKGNPFLIESGQRGDGYRLSTPARNVELVVTPPGISERPSP